MFSKMFHHMADIRRHLMFGVILAHEIDRIPMIFSQLDIFIDGEFVGDFLTPGVWVYQISLIICDQCRTG